MKLQNGMALVRQTMLVVDPAVDSHTPPCINVRQRRVLVQCDDADDTLEGAIVLKRKSGLPIQ